MITSAQTPIYKIDLNQSGRSDAEVNELGYISWTLPATTKDTATLSLSGGVTVKLIRKGPYGDKLSTNWFKNIIGSPNYARLCGDGVRVNNGTSGAQIEMRISGLPAGRHSILTYHNNVDNPQNNTFVPIDIYLDGMMKYDNLVAGIRDSVLARVPYAYMYADALPGQDIVVWYVADTSFTANNKNLMINGIEINNGNPLYMAQTPVPANGEEHVDCDNGSTTVAWTNAFNAVASHVYLGTDSATVATAGIGSPEYLGRTTNNNVAVNNQYSMNTYYWRVDQEDANGDINHGHVWYYRPRQLAFKDAEGYGRFARGGRGGKVVHVTNLNDAGPGSLREAVTNNVGPRTIVFDVSGLITLQSRLVVSNNYVTVAGQTAPGKGICIRSAPFGMGGNDVIVRHVRVRVGAGITYDGMGLNGNHSIIDNCSISWTIDEGFSSRGAKNISLQRTMIAEALNIAGHQNYPAGTAHGYAATIGGNTGSFHHNLLAHCDGRNWSMGGGLDGSAYYAGELDITNNVVYNWYDRTTDGGAHEVNFVNNYYKPGAASKLYVAITANHEGVGLGTQQYYVSGNVMPGYFDETTQDLGKRIKITNGAIVNWQTWFTSPFFNSYVTTQSAKDAYKQVLSNVGCNEPVFDDHDIRMVNETLNGTYTYRGSISTLPGLPDNQADVGGWENYPEEHRTATFDTDNDGLPDWWENIKGLNNSSAANDFSDANNDADHNGFTQLDDYLEWMGGPHYFMTPDNTLSIDLKTLARGYTNSPVFTTANVVNGGVAADPANPGTVIFTPTAAGLASFAFTVTDAEGSTMTRTVNILADVNATLPVSLVNFQTKRKDATTVAVSWETEQETNNDHFEVQRTFSPGIPFTTIATISSKANKGNSAVKLMYEAKDLNDNNDISYYRLVQKDLDGKSTFSGIRTVTGSDVLLQAKVWPVPSKGRFSVLFNNAKPITAVRIYNIDGKVVGKETIIQSGVVRSFTITTPGTYFIKGIDKETGEVVFTNKVVIE
ncbi:T9SS type A sorting domain-containing protein [Niastella sp. MAH-29]|uniref:T9SS type A sorting domain-containing protein n=2 Tax=Chitinophagaceae TaxID=563835 RepID=A0ABS3Z584_9BACT|nr:T9SS type A sorting domain-containing protein [Niastella soli]